jgi:hypothetical protein
MKILCAPTTENCYLSYLSFYDKLDAEYILLSPNLRSHKDECTLYNSDKRIKNQFLIYPHGIKFLKTYRLLYKCVEDLLNRRDYDVIVVSNRNGYPQSILCDVAVKKNIPIIFHQVASGTIPNLSFIKRASSLIFSIILHFLFKAPLKKPIDKNISLSILLGKSWASDLLINNFVVEGNYKYLMDVNINKNKDGSKQCFIFLGQPFYELKLLDKKQTIALYTLINELEVYLKSNNIDLYYRPHPQEKEYKSFIDFSINDIDQFMSIFSKYDGFISLCSTGSLEAKLRGLDSYCLNYKPLLKTQMTQASENFTHNIYYKDGMFNIVPFKNNPDLEYYAKPLKGFEDRFYEYIRTINS